MCAAGGLHDDPPTSAAPHRPAQQPTPPVRDDLETARLPSVPATDSTSNKNSEQIESVAIRFAGDSGDGMQLTGTKFTDETALAGNDLSTFPDFPAEIRAPAGTMAGVSGFQIHFSSRDIHTPADRPDVLIAFNPAALRANVDDVRSGGTVIINIDSFNEKSLKRAGYDGDPLPDLRERYNLVEIPFTTLNREALQGLDLSSRDIDRCKNFFALGVLCWLYGRPMDATERWLAGKFKDQVLEGNIRTLRAGYAFGETTELFPTSFVVPSAKAAPIVEDTAAISSSAWKVFAPKWRKRATSWSTSLAGVIG